MVATATLYRVIIRITGSYQPIPSETFWNRQVVYCGYDRLEAARIYHESKPNDYFYGFGNKCRSTLGEKKAISEQ